MSEPIHLLRRVAGGNEDSYPKRLARGDALRRNECVIIKHDGAG